MSKYTALKTHINLGLLSVLYNQTLDIDIADVALRINCRERKIASVGISGVTNRDSDISH